MNATLLIFILGTATGIGLCVIVFWVLSISKRVSVLEARVSDIVKPPEIFKPAPLAQDMILVPQETIHG